MYPSQSSLDPSGKPLNPTRDRASTTPDPPAPRDPPPYSRTSRPLSISRPLPTPPSRREVSQSPPLYSSRLAAPALPPRPSRTLSTPASTPAPPPTSASVQWTIPHWPRDRTVHCMLALGEEYILFGTSRGLMASQIPLKEEEGPSAPRTLTPIPTTLIHSTGPSSPILLVMGGQVRMYTATVLLQLCRFQDTWPSILDPPCERKPQVSTDPKRGETDGVAALPSSSSPPPSSSSSPNGETDRGIGVTDTATSLLRGLGGTLYRETERLSPLLPPSLGRRLRGQSWGGADQERSRLFSSLLGSYQPVGHLTNVKTLDAIPLSPVSPDDEGRTQEWCVCVGSRKSTNLYYGSISSGLTLEAELWNPETPKQLHLIRKRTPEKIDSTNPKTIKAQSVISHILVQYTRELVLLQLPDLKVTTVDQLPGSIDALTPLTLPRLDEKSAPDTAILISCQYGWSLLRSTSPSFSGGDRTLSPGVLQGHVGEWTAFDQWSSSAIGPDIVQVVPLPPDHPQSIACIGLAGIQIRGAMGQVLAEHQLPPTQVPVQSCAWPKSSRSPSQGPNRLLVLSLSPSMPLPSATLSVYLDHVAPSEPGPGKV